MTQTSYASIAANQTGTQYRTQDNDRYAAGLSMHSGSARPSYAVAGTQWLETDVTPWNLWVFDGTDDILVGTVNASTNAFIPANSAAGTLLSANNLSDLASASTARTNLGFSAVGQAVGTAADAAAQRTALGLGTAATVDIIDEDDMATNSATRPPSQQSVKAYVDASAGGGAAFKNLIIGGDFSTNPWQRGTSFTAPAAGSYVADRFFQEASGGGVYDILKTADAPTASQAGVYTQHCLHLDVTTADTSIAASDSYSVLQAVEGLNCAPLALGQVGAATFTMSFWVKATKTGTYCVSFRNSAGDRRYIAEYTVSVSDTWEKKVVTVPGDTTGTWLFTTGTGIMVRWTIAAGTSFQAAAGSWGAGGEYCTSSQVNGMDSTANNFKVTLIQLEEGSAATDFEALPYDVVLVRCKRYFQAANGPEVLGMWLSSSTVVANWIHTVDMRVSPSVAMATTTPTFVQPGVASRTGSGSVITAATAQPSGSNIQVNGFSGSTAGDFAYLYNPGVLTFTASAEL